MVLDSSDKLILNGVLTHLKLGEQLPSGSYYPIDVPCFKSRFQNKNILSGLAHFRASGNINYTGITKWWQCFDSAGGSGHNRN